MSKTLKRYALALVLLLIGVFAVACTPDDPNGNTNANSVGFGQQSEFLVLGNSEHNHQQFTATITPANARQQTFDWSSSNESIARVNQVGLVEAVAPGKTTIVAKLQGTELSIEREIVVYSAAETVRIGDVANKKLRIGHNTLGRATLEASVQPATAAQVVTFSSKDPLLLSVNRVTGDVVANPQNANNFGYTATVVATILGDYTADGKAIETEIDFELYTVPNGVNVDFANGSIDEIYVGGPTTTLHATVLASTAEQVVDWSDDSNYLVVNQDGVAAAQDIGDREPQHVTVTATERIFGTNSASRAITVYQAPASIKIQTPFAPSQEIETLDDETDTTVVTRRLVKGSVLPLSATVEPYNAKQDIVWSVVNNDDTRAEIATIDQQGILTTTGDGNITVVAADFFGVVKHSINFVVEDAERAKIDIKGINDGSVVVGNEYEITIGAGNQYQKLLIDNKSPDIVDTYQNGRIGTITIVGEGSAILGFAVPVVDNEDDNDLSDDAVLFDAQMFAFGTITRAADFVNKYSHLNDINDIDVQDMVGQALVDLMVTITDAQLYSFEIAGLEPESSIYNTEYQALLVKINELEESITNQLPNKVGEDFADFLTQVETDFGQLLSGFETLLKELLVLVVDNTLITQDKLDQLKDLSIDLAAILQGLSDLTRQVGLSDDQDERILQTFLIDSINQGIETLQQLMIDANLDLILDELQNILNNAEQAELAA
ncbi:MAG: Ig-like domain-containing protein [Clostridiales bacterium]|nr:Ig-like domain-containing protein [Clostridiales bacterium]